MAPTFKKATRKKAKLRLALIGPSGSGKTMSALLIAKTLGQRIAVIDSECGSASKYAGYAADFDVLELETFAPRMYVEAIRAAEQAGYDVIVVDSLSHAWAGKGGALEMVDNAAKRSKSGNSYTAWRDVTPEHNSLVDALVGCKAHLIATMRAKTEYVLQDGPNGKKTPQKIGMAPIQRDGLDFEFDVVAEMDLEHNFLVTKSRCPTLDAAVINRPGEQVARTLLAWLSDGEAAPVKPVASTYNPLKASQGESGWGDANGPAPDMSRKFGDAVIADTHGNPIAAAAKIGKVDEYGLTVPTSKCPVVSAQAREHAGKSWMDVPQWMVIKWLEKDHERMRPDQIEWATYIAARRSARKAIEAAQAEMAASANADGGGWIAGDEPAAAKDETAPQAQESA